MEMFLPIISFSYVLLRLRASLSVLYSTLLAGAYLPIHRTWEKGDEITVELDMRARLVELNEAQAIVRGPLVLARDSRFKDGDVDEASVIVSKRCCRERTMRGS